MKYILVSYTDNRYKLYNKGSCSTITSQDVIFDKGRGYHLLIVLDNIDDLVSDSPLSININVLGVLPI